MLIILVLLAHLSYYSPSTCNVRPINCLDPLRWWVAAGGLDVRNFYNRALACPQRYNLYSHWTISGSKYGALDRRYLCIDRGGMVTSQPDGSVILDLLTEEAIISQAVWVTVEFRQSYHGERNGWAIGAWRER